MLQRYFGFNGDPFGATPDSHFLYLSNTHREALASLKYGFYCNHGFTALIAPPGMGKTTLLFRFLTDIRECARTVFLFDLDVQCQPQELVRYILRDIGITPGQSNAEVHEQLKSVLLTEAQAGRRFVVVIDEGQNLSEAVLEKVRLLTNFETPRAKLMQIVLAGQPQLSEKLTRPSMVQLRQRISTVCGLDPFAPEETSAYVNHRLKIAGYDGKPLFTNEALSLIADASHGIPRTINNLCFNALSLCCALRNKQVNERMVADAIADLQLSQRPPEILASTLEVVTEAHQRNQNTKKSGRAKMWIPAVAAVTIMSVGCALAVARFYSERSLRFSQTYTLPATFKAPATTAKIRGTTIDSNQSQTTSPFEITVEPGESLSNIAVKHLGGFDGAILQKIESLNPRLSNPDHIEPGQKLRLPKATLPSGKENVTANGYVRNQP